MAKHKVEELEGALLDAAVAKAQGWSLQKHLESPSGGFTQIRVNGETVAKPLSFCPSSKWHDGGPIIERERIVSVPTTGYNDNGPVFWSAVCLGPDGAFSHYIDEPLPFNQYKGDPASAEGTTYLIAAMRAYVASKFGQEVELP